MGSFLHAEQIPLGARKQWLADNLIIRGRLHLDAGAVKAITREGKSLLAIGVHALDGAFERGAVVSCLSPEGKETARGLTNYGAADTQRILRTPSHAIAMRLGYIDEPELIHRDNLVLL